MGHTFFLDVNHFKKRLAFAAHPPEQKLKWSLSVLILESSWFFFPQNKQNSSRANFSRKNNNLLLYA
jgi:VanZ family protein